MKTKLLCFSKIALLGVLILCLSCCSDDSGPKKVGQETYTLTVASYKVPGLAGGGNSAEADVYAVKKEGQTQWSPFWNMIEGFEYEPGYEYVIRIKETWYVDDRRGDPAWSEYKLISRISKEKKESQGVPEDFLPVYDK